MISIPFSGSKKYSYKDVKEIVENGGYKKVYEPFGGSCVLSVNLKNDGIVEEAVANDYDRYFDFYPQYLNYKDLIVEESYKRGLRKVRGDKEGYYFLNDDNEKVRLTQFTLYPKERKILQEIILENIPREHWKFMCQGSNFTWSVVQTHNRVKLTDFCLFRGDLTTAKQREYLKALNKINLEHLDYKDFLKKYEQDIKNNSETLLILDPPYIGTEQNQYKGGFSISQTFDLVKRIKQLNCDFLFFTHDSVDIKELIPGEDLNIKEYGCTNNGNRKRKDVMAYVKRNKN